VINSSLPIWKFLKTTGCIQCRFLRRSFLTLSTRANTHAVSVKSILYWKKKSCQYKQLFRCTARTFTATVLSLQQFSCQCAPSLNLLVHEVILWASVHCKIHGTPQTDSCKQYLGFCQVQCNRSVWTHTRRWIYSHDIVDRDINRSHICFCTWLSSELNTDDCIDQDARGSNTAPLNIRPASFKLLLLRGSH
jgi:hypothetical protein